MQKASREEKKREEDHGFQIVEEGIGPPGYMKPTIQSSLRQSQNITNVLHPLSTVQHQAVTFYVLLPQMPVELQMVPRGIYGEFKEGEIKHIPHKNFISKIQSGENRHIAAYTTDISLPYAYTFRLITKPYKWREPVTYEERGNNKIRTISQTQKFPLLIYDALLRQEEEDLFLNFICFQFYLLQKKFYESYLQNIYMFISVQPKDTKAKGTYVDIKGNEYWRIVANILKSTDKKGFIHILILLGCFPETITKKTTKTAEIIDDLAKRFKKEFTIPPDFGLEDNGIQVLLNGLALIYSNLPNKDKPDYFFDEIKMALFLINKIFPHTQNDQIFISHLFYLCKLNRKYIDSKFAAYFFNKYSNNTEIMLRIAEIAFGFVDTLKALNLALKNRNKEIPEESGDYSGRVSEIINNFLRPPISISILQYLIDYTKDWPKSFIQRVLDENRRIFEGLFTKKYDFLNTIGLIETSCTHSNMKYLLPNEFANTLASNLFTTYSGIENNYLQQMNNYLEKFNNLVAIQSVLILIGCPKFEERMNKPPLAFINFIKEKIQIRLKSKELFKIENDLTIYATYGLSTIYYFMAEYYSSTNEKELLEEFKSIIADINTLLSPKSVEIFLSKLLNKWKKSQLLMRPKYTDYFLQEFGNNLEISLSLAGIASNLGDMMKCFEYFKASATADKYQVGKKISEAIKQFIANREVTLELLLHFMQATETWEDEMAKIILMSLINQFRPLFQSHYYFTDVIQLMNIYLEYKYLKYIWNECTPTKICTLCSIDSKNLKRIDEYWGIISSLFQVDHITSKTFKSLFTIISHFPEKERAKPRIEIIEGIIEGIKRSTNSLTQLLLNLQSQNELKDFVIDGLTVVCYYLSKHYLVTRINLFIEELELIIRIISENLSFQYAEVFFIALINLWKSTAQFKVPGELSEYILREYREFPNIMLKYAEIAPKFIDLAQALDYSQSLTNFELPNEQSVYETKISGIFNSYLGKIKGIKNISTIRNFLEYTKEWKETLARKVMNVNRIHFNLLISSIFHSSNVSQLMELYLTYEYMKYLGPDYNYDSLIPQFCRNQNKIGRAFNELGIKLTKANFNDLLLKYLSTELKNHKFTKSLFGKLEEIFTEVMTKLDQSRIFLFLIDSLYKQGFDKFSSYIDIVGATQFSFIIERFIEKYKGHVQTSNLEEKTNCFLTIALQFKRNLNNELSKQLIDIEEFNFEINEKQIIQQFILQPTKSRLYSQIIEHPAQFKLKIVLAEELVGLKNKIQNLDITLELGKRCIRLSKENQSTFMDFLAAGQRIIHPETQNIKVTRKEMEEICFYLRKSIEKIEENKEKLNNILTQFEEYFDNSAELFNTFNETFKEESSTKIRDFHYPDILKEFQEVIEKSQENGNICSSNSLVVLLKTLKLQNQNAESPISMTRLICNGITQLKESIVNISQNPDKTKISTLIEYFKDAIPNENNPKTKHEIDKLKNAISNQEGQQIFENLLTHFAQRGKYYDNCHIVLNFISIFKCEDTSNVQEACTFYIQSFSAIQELTILQFLDTVSKLKIDHKSLDVFRVIEELTKDGLLLKEFALNLHQDDLDAMKEAVNDYDIEAQSLLNLESIWFIINNIFAINNYLDIKQNIADFIKKDPTLQIISQIQDSIASLPYFKNLKKEMLRKEEANKQTIELIMKNSLIIESTSSTEWDIYLRYTSEISGEEKNLVHANLRELQDRAKLLIATHNSNSQKLDLSQDPQEWEKKSIDVNLFSNFVDFTDIFSRYIELRKELENAGYPFFDEQNMQMSYPCIQGLYMQFSQRTSYINELLLEWNSFVKNIYLTNYSMTHLYGNRFWILEECLSNMQNMPPISLFTFMNKDIRALQSDNYNNREFPNAFKRLENLSEYLRKLPNIEMRNTIKIEGIKPLKMKPRSVLYYETTNLIEGIISMFCVQNVIPVPNQLLFCSASTTWQQLTGFLIRCFMSKENEFFLLIQVDSLSHRDQLQFIELFEELYKKKKKFKLGILNTVVNSISKISQALRTKSYTYTFTDNYVFTPKQLEETIKKIQKEVLIVSSSIAGLGKSHWIKKHAESKRLINFPLEGEISVEGIGRRLLATNMNENLAICFQIQPVDDEDILTEIILQIILLRCLDSPPGVVIIPQECPIYIEIANFSEDRLTQFLRFTQYFPSHHIQDIELDKLENSNDLQIVCAHLYLLKEELLVDQKIDLIKDPRDELYKPKFRVELEDCIRLVDTYFIQELLIQEEEISFIQINIFIKRLSEALIGFSQTPIQFAAEMLTPDMKYLNDIIKNIRETLLKHIIESVSEFTSKSVKRVRFNQRLAISQEIIDNSDLHKDIIKWGDSNHFYVLFGPNGEFYSIYRKRTEIPLDVRHILVSQIELLEQFNNRNKNANIPQRIDYNIENLRLEDVSKLKDYSQMKDIELLNELLLMLNIEKDKFDENTKHSLLDNYSLIPDNFLKMVLIHSRAISRIPIIIMGETGVGKTALIRFLVQNILREKFEIMALNAGISSSDIIAFIERAEQKANDNNTKTWIFLDEFNTTNSIGLINEIVCHRSILGREISELLIFVCACNPYRIKSKGFDEENIGIKRKNQGNVKNSAFKLLYTVYPLPETMLNYVWDFGSLEAEAEKMHIDIIIGGIDLPQQLLALLANAVFRLQRYFKDEDSSSVSLRDVQRYKTICQYFQAHPNPTSLSPERPGILALVHCYYLRISNMGKRKQFLDLLSTELKIGVETIMEIYQNERAYYMSNMKIPEGLAQNEALSENIFAILVCLVNKIPIFLCGKPGCSKTLSIQLIISNLKGKNSSNLFLQKLPELVKIYFQGSLTCTSETINRAFLNAEKYTRTEDKEDLIPVVVFDEIGLAELSPHNPLKVLHEKLENENIQVAFIGISNWKLDASKMNRTLYLARPDPDLDDLIFTSECIFKSIASEAERTRKTLEIMHQLAKAYFSLKQDIRGKAFEDHFGLRDFYYLIKMISREFKRVGDESEASLLSIIKKGFERNFNSNEYVLEKIEDYFISQRKSQAIYCDLPVSSPLDLIKESMHDEHSRYLMIISPGEHGSVILENFLQETFPNHKTLFGSPFPENVEQYQIRTLSDIILYLESGIPITLRNLEDLYPSLYDLFNQSFVLCGGRRRCRIALGDFYSPNCVVHPNFNCIILMDEAQMQHEDSPFLNRFEKHFVRVNNILNLTELQIMKHLQDWIKNITTPRDPQINPLLSHKNVFINSSAETLAITIYEKKNIYTDMEEIIRECKRALISMSTPDLLVFAELSVLPQEEIEEIFTMYAELHCLTLEDIFRNAEKANHKKLIIYTFSKSIPREIFKQSIFKNKIECKKENISNLNNEFALKEDLENFLQSKDQVYIIEVDLSSENKYISYLNHFFDKYSKIIQESTKTICIIGLIKRNYMGIGKLSLPYFHNWDQHYIEELSSEKWLMKPEFAKQSITDLLNNTYKNEISDFMSSSLNKCFRTLKYTHKDKGTPEYRRTLCRKILEDKNLLKKLEGKVRIEISRSQKDWKGEMIGNQEIYLKSTTSYDAFRSSISYLIQTSITKIIYTLENESALNSILSFGGKSNNADKLKKLIWMDHFDRQIVDTKLQLQSGSESAIISLRYDLHFPFSKTEFENIQNLKERCFQSEISVEVLINEFRRFTIIGNHYDKFLNNYDIQTYYFEDLFHLLLQESYLETDNFCLNFLIAFVDRSEEIFRDTFENRLVIFIEYQDILLKLINLLKESALFLDCSPYNFLLQISKNSEEYETIEKFSTYFVHELLKFSYPTESLIGRLKTTGNINMLFEKQKNVIDRLIIEDDIEIEAQIIEFLDLWVHLTTLLNIVSLKEEEKLNILSNVSEKYTKLMGMNLNLYSNESYFLKDIDILHLKLMSENSSSQIQEKIQKFNAWKYFSLLKNSKKKHELYDHMKSIENSNLYKFLGFELVKYLCKKANISHEESESSETETEEFRKLIEYYLEDREGETYFKKYLHKYFVELSNIEDREIAEKMKVELDNFIRCAHLLEEEKIDPIEELRAKSSIESYLGTYSQAIHNDCDLEEKTEDYIQDLLAQNSEIGKQFRDYTMENIKKINKKEGNELRDYIQLNGCKYPWMEKIITPNKFTCLDIYPLVIQEGIKNYIIEWRILLLNYVSHISTPIEPEQNQNIINFVIKSAHEGHQARIGFLFAIISTSISLQIDDAEHSEEQYALLQNMFETHNEIFKKFFKHELTKFVKYVIFEFVHRELLLKDLEYEILAHRKIFELSVLAIIIGLGGAGIENPLSSLFFKKGEVPAEISLIFSTMYPPGGEEDEIIEFYKGFENKDPGKYGGTNPLFQCSEPEVCPYLYTNNECGLVAEISDCPWCKQKIGGEGHNVFARTGHKMITQGELPTFIRDRIRGRRDKIRGGYHTKAFPANSQQEEKARDIQSYITYRILHLIQHISLKYFLIDRDEELSKILFKNSDKYKNSEEPSEIVGDHIEKDFELLEEALNIPFKSHIWLYQIINILPNLLNNFQKPASTAQLRMKFEQEFECQIMSYIKNKQNTVNKYKEDFARYEEQFKTQDTEPNSPKIYENELNLQIFGTASLEGLKQNYYASYQIDFPLVDFLLKNYNRILSIQSLFPILNFTNYLIEKLSYKINRENARANIRMKEYLLENPKITFLWEGFLAAWKNAKFGAKLGFACTELDYRDFSEEDNLINFLVDDKEKGNGLYMLAALQYLGLIYNDLIIQFQSCIPPQSINRRAIRLPLQKMREEDCINLSLDINTLAEDYNYANLDNPTENNYQYEAISEVVLRAFVGKQMIKLHDEEGFSTIIYQGESSNKLIEEIRKEMPQNELPRTEYKKLEELFTEIQEKEGNEGLWHSLKQILIALEGIFIDMTNMKSDPTFTLQSFLHSHGITEFEDSLKGSPKALSRLLSLKLEYIVALYEYLEYKFFPYFRQLIEQPFIVAENAGELAEIAQVENFFGEYLKENIVHLLLGEDMKLKLGNVLRRFIIRNLGEEIDKLCPLFHYLDKSDLWPGKLTEKDRKLILDKLPTQILVKHAFCLVDYLDQPSNIN